MRTTGGGGGSGDNRAVTVRVDTARFRAAVQQLARATNRTFDDILREQMRLALEWIVRATPPGRPQRTAGAQATGKARIGQDLDALFIGVRLKRKRQEQHPDVEEIHRQHWTRSTRSPLRPQQGRKYYVDQAKLRALRLKLEAKVGQLAANWLHALWRLGSRKAVPLWIRRHSPKGGQVEVNLRGRVKTIRAINELAAGTLRSGRVAGVGQRYVNLGLDIQARKMERRADYLLKLAARRSGWRTG